LPRDRSINWWIRYNPSVISAALSNIKALVPSNMRYASKMDYALLTRYKAIGEYIDRLIRGDHSMTAVSSMPQWTCR